MGLPFALPALSHAKVARRFTATVTNVQRGILRLDTLQTLRLAHIDVPRPPQPWGRQGEAGLLALALGRRVVVEPTAREPDRRGHIPAEVWLAEAGGTPDVHLARELLRLGLARVRPYGEDDLDLAEWFADELEDAALDIRDRGGEAARDLGVGECGQSKRQTHRRPPRETRPVPFPRHCANPPPRSRSSVG